MFNFSFFAEFAVALTIMSHISSLRELILFYSRLESYKFRSSVSEYTCLYHSGLACCLQEEHIGYANQERVT